MRKKQVTQKVSFKKKVKHFRRKITYSNAFIKGVSTAGFILIHLYSKTLRIQFQWHPDSKYLDKSKVLYGFWHGRQFLLVPSFKHQKVAIMSDVSWAGEIQTRMLEKFGYHMVRGSSKRKGAQALLNMKRALQSGYTPAFALDGPRGPIYEAKPGIVFLSKKMNVPVLPLITSAKNKWIIKSTWCQYEIPKPLSRCLVSIGAPVWCQHLEEDEALKKIDTTLVQLMHQTDKSV